MTKKDDSLGSLYKDGAIVNLGQNPRHVQKVKTNRPSVDYVTDGGVPRGRLILVAGKPSSFKSSESSCL
jgi:RecA/RadA recombinase